MIQRRSLVHNFLPGVHYWSHTNNFERFLRAHEDDGLKMALTGLVNSPNPIRSSDTVLTSDSHLLKSFIRPTWLSDVSHKTASRSHQRTRIGHHRQWQQRQGGDAIPLTFAV